jgi:UDP-glucuronate 4-epimerase
MATYIVTGVAGFIGSRVASKLLENGDRVVGVDNLNDYYDVRLKQFRLEELKKKSGFEFHELDIENRVALSKVFEGEKIEGVLNLAARAGVRYSMENPYVYLMTNSMGTLNLLELMVKSGVKKMVLASTSSLYAGQDMPFSEDLAVNTPISPYAASKKAAEAMAYSYHYLHGLDISVVRYFTVFGPCGRPDMSIFRFIKWIDEGLPIELFGDGSQSRDFTYVEDVARGTVAALKEVGYEVVNIGGGKNPISLNTIIGWIESQLGKSAIINREPFHKADIVSTWADISKAGKLFSWRPEVSVEEGVRRTVEWHLEKRDWLKNIEL